MADDSKTPENPKDKYLMDLISISEISEQQKASKEAEPHKEKKTAEKEEAEAVKIAEEEAEIEANPDLEDPRLYSPLQEPDRPAPSLREHDERPDEKRDKKHDERHDETPEPPPKDE